MSEAMVTIPESEYKALKAAAAKLLALENAGVDNWEWYGDAIDAMDEAGAP